MPTTFTAPHLLDRLIDRHQRLVEVRRALAEEGGPAARREFAHLREGPWLTFSTERGALGRDVARRAAEVLGWQLFDKEILSDIAHHTAHRERVLSLQDERPMSPLDDYVKHLFVPGYTPRSEFEIELAKVIAAVGRSGRAVLLGRGANWILNPSYGLRVRMIAPKDLRVERIVEREKLTRREAERHVDEDDDRKRKFIRQVYHRDIADPSGYDLLVNTAGLDIDAAAEIVLFALRGKLEQAPTAAPAP